MKRHRFFGRGLPYLEGEELQGTLIVIEGPDCSGRSTQVFLLKEWLEAEGFAVLNTGLKRSNLVADAISEAKQGNLLGRTTLSLLYATDFADQLENKIIPALKAGFVVLADRYVFTLMARDIVRGAPPQWLEKVLGFAVVPDMICYLKASPDVLLPRAFSKYGHLDYWESGMDIGFSQNMLESFKRYQAELAKVYDQMAEKYGFIAFSADTDIAHLQIALRRHIAPLLDIAEVDEDVDLTNLQSRMQAERG